MTKIARPGAEPDGRAIPAGGTYQTKKKPFRTAEWLKFREETPTEGNRASRYEPTLYIQYDMPVWQNQP